MKKIAKVLGAMLGLVVLILLSGATFIALDWPVRRAVSPPDVKIEYTAERVARGKTLASTRCVFCHYDQKTGALTGHEMLDAPKEFGAIFSHNITRHPTRGTGRYSDGELVYLLRTGIRRDGVFTGPFMQSPFLSDEDIYAIIAFLRSDDPLVAPHDVADRQWQPSFLAKMLMHVAFKPMELPKAPIATPDGKDPVALGRYVAVALGDCFVCHSADFKKLDALHPEQSGGFFGGGNLTLDAAGNTVPTANITMDEETGIGKWSEADFVYAVRSGIRKDGRALRFPMMPFGDLSEDEVRAVFAYLKTVPKLHNAVDRGFDKYPGMAASASEGERLYFKYACSSCHGPAGVGVCDLRQAGKTYDTDAKLSEFIHEPAKFVPGTKMPTWNGIIPETDYPPLIAHVHALAQAAGAGGATGAVH